MKIIQPWGPTHRDDGAALYMFRALNRLEGVTVERVSTDEANEKQKDYDAIVYVDWGQDCFPNTQEFFPDPDKPSLIWQSDTHWTDAAREYRCNQATRYQVAAFCQKGMFKSWSAGPNYQRTTWIPHAVDHTVYTPLLAHYDTDRSHWPADPEIIRKYIVGCVPKFDLGWVGHCGDERRENYLDAMFKQFPNFFFGAGMFFEEAAKVYAYSKMVFNISVRSELNMRTFEALATRSFLLTDRQDGMEELGLKDGVHCAIYDTLDEAIDKAKFYVGRDGVRERIAEEGWKWALSNNTYQHRAQRILDLLQGKA